MVKMPFVIYLKKTLILLLTDVILILIVLLRRCLGFIKQTWFKTVIAESTAFFIVLTQISHNHFCFINCTDNLCSADVSVSVDNM